MLFWEGGLWVAVGWGRQESSMVLIEIPPAGSNLLPRGSVLLSLQLGNE